MNEHLVVEFPSQYVPIPVEEKYSKSFGQRQYTLLNEQQSTDSSYNSYVTILK